MANRDYDFSGYATRNDLLCGDGRTIRKNAFEADDGQIVPLIWNHAHGNPSAVLGHALLENRDDGVYAYCKFNDTKQGQDAKIAVMHGDIRSLSIYANKLKHVGSDVVHGVIRELSLVVAGANPGAYVDFVAAHGEDGEDSVYANYDENALIIYHSDIEPEDPQPSEESDEDVEVETEAETETEAEAEVEVKAEAETEESEIQHSDEKAEEDSDKEEKEKTLGEAFEAMPEEHKEICYAMVQIALDAKETEENIDDSEGGKESMKQNIFETDNKNLDTVLSHADQAEILGMAKSSGCGSLKEAMAIYAEKNNLQHDDITISGFAQAGNGSVTTMFPEYVEAHPSRTPELITNDMGWVDAIMAKTQKIPHGRVRTSHVDIRNIDALKAKGYKKGDPKNLTGNYELVRRTTDPQTVYVTSALHRDDVVDIEDFDYVAFQYNIDQMSLKETLAVATLLGDERPDEDAEKIFPDKIRPIWTDDELYTIHKDIDFAAMAKELQGENAEQYFGENFIYSEAMVNALRKARKDYRGTGKPDMFITTDMLSTMILARDRDGRRLYATETELAAALGVGNIYEVSQMEGKVRTDKDGKKHNLIAICVNPADYGYGASKGGDITHFTDFDIKFNQLQSLLETRKSGQLTRIKSAIVIEELVDEAAG